MSLSRGWRGAVLVAVVALGAACDGEVGEQGAGGVTAPRPGLPGEVVGMTVGGDGGAGSVGMMGGPPSTAGELAHGIDVTDVAVYQAVKVALTRDGRPLVTLDAPLITGRAALLRVFVTPRASWQPRPLVARLNLGPDQAIREVTATIAGRSSDESLGTTLNFSLPPAAVGATFRWAISLHEVAGRSLSGSTAGAQLPADGTPVAVATKDPGPSLKIVFVPLRYNDNGVARLPDTGPGQLQFLTDAMFATYPIGRVEATVRAPLELTTVIEAGGNGWASALNDVCLARQTDHPARNVFYYGLVAPAASFHAYCGNACVSGIAVLASSPGQDAMRCAMGVGFSGMGSGVFLQEVAHAMGRKHAPCGGATQPDTAFPYLGAHIGVWGYDLLHGKLIDPARTVDFMSYCSPAWISDYTFKNLAAWIGAVNALAGGTAYVSASGQSPELIAAALAHPAARWRAATVEADGTVIWGDVVDTGALTGGAPRVVTVRAPAGGQAGHGGGDQVVEGLFYPHSLGAAGLLLLPPSVSPRARAIELQPGDGFRAVVAR